METQNITEVLEIATTSKINTDNLVIHNEDVIPIIDISGKIPVPRKCEVQLTVELVTELLGYHQVPIEKHLNERRVIELSTQMLQNTFDWSLVIFAIGTFESKIYRLNGQHTSAALMRALLDRNFAVAFSRKCIMVTLLHYKIMTRESLHRVYITQNTTKTNTKGQFVNALVFGSKGYEDIPIQARNLMQASIQGWRFGFDKQTTRKMLPDEIAYVLVKDVPSISAEIVKIISGNHSDMSHIQRAPTVAAMYETFSKDIKAGKEFWGPIRLGDGLSKDDPRLRLKNWLSKTPVQKKDGREKMYRYCIGCWNLWRSGQNSSGRIHCDVDRGQSRVETL